jgi:hypothetical protein
MADVLGTNYTLANNPTAANRIAGGKVGGNIKSITDSYTWVGEAIASTLKVGKDLPAGAVIQSIILQNAALGASSTIRVGDSNDDDRYMTDIATSSAAVTTDINIAGNLYVIGTNSGDDTIVILTAGGTCTGVMKIVVNYSTD